MMNDTSLLDALVMSAPNDPAIIDQHGADRYATGSKTLFGLFDGSFKEGVSAHGRNEAEESDNSKYNHIVISPLYRFGLIEH